MARETESAPATRDGIATPMFGGNAPSPLDIQRSANARGEQRHDMTGSELADINVLPDSARMANNEMVGIHNNGYLVKKGIPFGANAMLQSLPPGMDIEDQENADIRVQPMKTYSGGTGFGDGWS